MIETDLFAPVRDYFLACGYAVSAEVAHCDVVARKESEVAIVELKTRLNLKLLTQGVDRQKITQHVYLAVPAPSRETRQWRATAHLVKRLGLGLLLVTSSPLRAWAYERYRPNYAGKPVKRRREALLKEFEARKAHANVGGASGVPIVTAYRETAICIATLLEAQGPLAPRQVAPVCGPKSGAILYANHYGWFERVARGVYDLSPDGRHALVQYAQIREMALTAIDRRPDRTE